MSRHVALLASFAVAAPATPAALLASSLAAARAQSSVHYVTTQSSPVASVRIVGDAAVDRGVQRITFRRGPKTGHVTVVVVANTAYVRGDEFALANYMGLAPSTASADAGRWIRIPHTSPSFATIAAAVRLRSTIGEIQLRPPLTAVAATTIRGRRVLGVRSRHGAYGQETTVTLYISGAGRPLPVAEVAAHGAEELRVDFGGWGEAVHVSAPAHAISLR